MQEHFSISSLSPGPVALSLPLSLGVRRRPADDITNGFVNVHESGVEDVCVGVRTTGNVYLLYVESWIKSGFQKKPSIEEGMRIRRGRIELKYFVKNY